MRHVSLYRKWRPRTFDAIVGQEAVVRTLKRALETGRVAHAYLFSGPRGTGKTSTAKVLAMSLNCAEGPTPEPDGTCDSCRAIINNSSMDVLEMDAASNRGIEEIRDLRDKVNLAPAQGRMKVYIIDEVHMLTTEAFNALLKMLEEPPEHVVFVLATTEKHKVLPTIISRCQSFDFRRPSVETLVGKLEEISEAEGIEVEPEALTVIAREGRGSFRDAEGLLDQLSSFSEGRITAPMVRELLGGVGPEALVETTYALSERRAVDALGDSLSRIRRGGDPKLELELTFLKLTRDYTEPDLNALQSRLEILERTVANGSVAAGTPRPATDTTEAPREVPRSAEREPEQGESKPEAPARGGPEEPDDRPGGGGELALGGGGVMG